MQIISVFFTQFCHKTTKEFYSDTDDELFANRSYVMLHTRLGGDKTIRLPEGKYNVTELYSKRKLGTKVSSFTDPKVPAGTTRLYLLEK